MKSIFSSSAFVAMIAPAAWAQPPQNQNFGGQPPAGGPAAAAVPPSNALFDALDTDGDGVITTKELRKAVASLKQLDADHDGNITREEASAGRAGGDPAKEVDRIIKEYDKNGDGKLSPNEIPQKETAMLAGSDTNNDGMIDRQELTTAMEKMHNQPGTGAPGFAPANGGPNNAGSGGNGDQSIRQLMRGDRNGDGKLTPDEVEPRMRDMLREADTNRDGAIDGQELQSFVQMMHDQMNGRGPGGQQPNRPGRGNMPPQPNSR